ncbi:glycosyltransferase 87 family protein [Amycolatopsis cihanbeyliensis]|uniref:Alpha-1,2-mannosyltransferase n=1 Tax=Amycolatopsis cihanbeyliensis TaxID=1128664 RepID=A0A542DNV3_AMYCI|nr:glycosyltransferase 87 family protein [Amycolatopsis cihanbeyliensis]TQJ04776.1 alpha-1,2-mannosyltransferase [Amycolatopsis cihanbeyliensis]
MSTRRLPAEFRPGGLSRGRLSVGLLVAVALAVGVLAWLTGWRLGADAEVYRAGALTFLHGDPLYIAERLATLPSWVSLPFTYPPAAALLFVPLAALPPGLCWGLVTASSVLALTLVVRSCLRTGARRLPGAFAVAGLSLLALALEPVWKTLFLGQVNLLLMALVVLDVLVLCARGSRWSGVLVGVAAAVKLTPLIFLPHLLFTGRWRAALRGLGTFAGLQGLMFLLMPADAGRYWAEAASDPERVGAVHWIFNQSLNGMVSRATGLAPWSLGAAVGIAALLAVPAIWLVVRLHRRGETAAALLVTAFYALLASPVSWSHHWVWAVPLIVLLLTRGRTWWALAVTAFFASAVIMFVPNGGRAEFGWGPVAFVLGNAYVLAVVLGILGLAAREWHRDRALL